MRQLPKYRPTIEPIPTKAQLQQQQQQLSQVPQANQIPTQSPPSLSPMQSSSIPASLPAQDSQPLEPKITQQQPQAYNQPQQYNSQPQQPYKPMVNSFEPQQQQQQAQPTLNGAATSQMNSIPANSSPGGTHLRRGGTATRSDHDASNPAYSFQQAMSDHFDHYKRPPSRDSSVDRYTRATRMSRQPSADIQGPPSIALAASMAGSQTPVRGRTPFGREGSVEASSSLTAAPSATGAAPAGATASGARRVLLSQNSTEKLPPSNGSVIGGDQGGYVVPSTPFEEIIMRKKSLGQDIIPSLGQPKRTESLFVNRREPAPKVS